ncbi:MAG: MFS transporter [Alphaproteobacteria bacterium]|nr:MFS transporter [Alphaproteobacteria bacterium]
MEKFNQPIMRNIPLIYAGTFLGGLNIYAPIIVIYMAQVLGSYALAMSLFAITQISAAALELPTGVMSDKIGRKWTGVAGAMCGFLGVLCYAVGMNFSVFVAGAILLGLSAAFISGNDDAMLYDTLKQVGAPEDFHKHKGRTGSLDQAALGISAFIASGIILIWGLHATVIATLVPLFLGIIVAILMREPSVNSRIEQNIYAHLKTSIKQVFKNRKLRLLTFGKAIAWGFGESQYQFVAAFYKTLIPVWAIGYLRAATNALAALGYFISDKVTKRIGDFKAVFYIGVIGWFVYLAAILMANIATPFIRTAMSVFYGIRMPAQDAIMQREFTDHQRATMGNVVAFFKSLSFAACSLFVGWVADVWSPYVAMITACVLSGLAWPFVYKALKPESKL